MRNPKNKSEFKVLARNRFAFHDYDISDRFEAGLSLLGTEIKSIRAGGISLKEGYVRVKDGEVWLMDTQISPYSHTASTSGHETFRPRKLLLHRYEIDSIVGKVQRKGLTIIPLQIYIKNNHAKIEIGLARSKKNYQKKQDIIDRDMARDTGREIKQATRERR